MASVSIRFTMMPFEIGSDPNGSALTTADARIRCLLISNEIQMRNSGVISDMVHSLKSLIW